MAYRDVKTITGDLRVTENDKGAFLTVDDNCNLKWVDSRVTASGGVWEYNFIDANSYIILPPAKLNVGLCIAIMRGKDSITRDHVSNNGGSGSAGVVEDRANPKIIILPYNNGTAEKPSYDYIMNGPNFYCSSGVSWNSVSETFDINNMEFDEFSSVIFKSVYCGDNTYSWVIINGVGLWNSERLDETGIIYAKAKATFPEHKVTLQTASVNSLSAGINTTDTEFTPIHSISESGALKARQNLESNSVEIIPQNADQDVLGKYINPTTYVIGRFTDDFSGSRNLLYTEFKKAGVNIFGPVSYWNQTIDTNEVVVNQIGDAVSYLGYIYDDHERINLATQPWWVGLGKKSFSKRLGLRQKGTITKTAATTVGASQLVINIKLDKIVLRNQKSTDYIRSVYAMIQSFFEISNDYTMPYTNVFKVPGNVYSAEEIISDSDIVTLSSAGLGESNTDFGTGSIMQIPITDKDIAVGSFNIVLEFLYRPNGIGTPESEQQTSIEKFAALNNKSNQYCIINFIGIEQLKSTSISPEINFDNIGITRVANVGEITQNAEESVFEVFSAYLDKDSTSVIEASRYIGVVLNTGSFSSIGFDINQAGRSFFDSNGRYYPANNITKTVIEYSSGKASETNITLSAKFVIDWVERKWQFNGVLNNNGNEHICSQNSHFSEAPETLYFYEKNLKTFKLTNAIHIQYNGLYRLPWIFNESDNSKYETGEARINITHFKTVVHQTGLIETLINYRCGWERAEAEWTTKAITDGSEYDGLVSDYSTKEEGTDSPSKLCIKPSHAMQLEYLKQIRFSRSESIDDATQPKRALLPYLTNDNTTGAELRYFSTDWRRTQLNIKSLANLRFYSSGMPLVANEFCELLLSPQTTGTLIANIDIPVNSIPSSTGYLILRELLDSDTGGYGDYTLVKDSGAAFVSTQTPGYNTLKIDFIDNVIELKKYRYTIVIYDAPWVNTNVNIEGENARSAIMGANNTAIVRYRPPAFIGAQNEMYQTGINDFRGLFANVNTNSEDGPIKLSKNSASRNIYSLFNKSRQEVEDITNDGVDRTNLDYSKLLNNIFETSGNDKIDAPNKKCIGATFSFHVYVLKEGN